MTALLREIGYCVCLKELGVWSLTAGASSSRSAGSASRLSRRHGSKKDADSRSSLPVVQLRRRCIRDSRSRTIRYGFLPRWDLSGKNPNDTQDLWRERVHFKKYCATSCVGGEFGVQQGKFEDISSIGKASINFGILRDQSPRYGTRVTTVPIPSRDRDVLDDVFLQHYCLSGILNAQLKETNGSRQSGVRHPTDFFERLTRSFTAD